MAPINKSNYLYLATAALLLLLLSGAQAKFLDVNPFCRTSNYRRICTKMVSGASSRGDASTSAMASTRELAANLKGLVPVLVRPAIKHLDPLTQESIMKTCVENYDGIVDDMEVSIKAVQDGDIGSARSHLSAAFRTDCKDAMKESGAVFPEKLGDYSRYLTISVDNSLAVLMQN